MSEHRLDPSGLVVYLRTTNRTEIARQAGIDRRQVKRWLNEGQRIRLSTAERIADHLQTHPSIIFPDYYGDNLQ